MFEVSRVYEEPLEFENCQKKHALHCEQCDKLYILQLFIVRNTDNSGKNALKKRNSNATLGFQQKSRFVSQKQTCCPFANSFAVCWVTLERAKKRQETRFPELPSHISSPQPLGEEPIPFQRFPWVRRTRVTMSCQALKVCNVLRSESIAACRFYS